MRLLHTLPVWLLLSATTFANPITEDEQAMFIETWALHAVREMSRSSIPASITLAQAILESSWGQGATAVNANNYFGIKCYNGWSGNTYFEWDDEKTQSCFRSYNGVEESFKDHSDFLKDNPRYAPLFEHPTTDYKSWAKTLKACGYATAEHYADKLIELIEKHGLSMYDYAMPVKSTKMLEAPVMKVEMPAQGIQQVEDTRWDTNPAESTAPEKPAQLSAPQFNIEPQTSPQTTTPGEKVQQEANGKPTSGKVNVKAKTILPLPKHHLERR